MSASSAQEVYDVLVAHAGAEDSPSMRSQFDAFWERRHEAMEFRFQGALGFGGKIFCPKYQAPYVSCYREDDTPHTQAVIDQTNAALAPFCEE